MFLFSPAESTAQPTRRPSSGKDVAIEHGSQHGAAFEAVLTKGAKRPEQPPGTAQAEAEPAADTPSEPEMESEDKTPAPSEAVESQPEVTPAVLTLPGFAEPIRPRQLIAALETARPPGPTDAEVMQDPAGIPLTKRGSAPATLGEALLSAAPSGILGQTQSVALEAGSPGEGAVGRKLGAIERGAIEPSQTVLQRDPRILPLGGGLRTDAQNINSIAKEFSPRGGNLPLAPQTDPGGASEYSVRTAANTVTGPILWSAMAGKAENDSNALRAEVFDRRFAAAPVEGASSGAERAAPLQALFATSSTSKPVSFAGDLAGKTPAGDELSNMRTESTPRPLSDEVRNDALPPAGGSTSATEGVAGSVEAADMLPTREAVVETPPSLTSAPQRQSSVEPAVSVAPALGPVVPLAYGMMIAAARDAGSKELSQSVFDRDGFDLGPATSTFELRGSATVTPVPVSPSGQTVTSQIAQAFAAAQTGGTQLRLDPEELGRVTLNMVSDDRSITLIVMADRPETLDLLRRHIDTLAQDFRDLGFEDITFQFGHEDTHSGEQETGNDGAAAPVELEVQTPANVPGARATAAGQLDIRL